MKVPGDKSISHRALLVAMQSTGRFHLTGVSPAADVTSTLRAVRSLGVDELNVQVDPQAQSASTLHRDFQIEGASGGIEALTSPAHPIDVGNSGTTLRILTGIIAGSQTTATLTGDESIRRRPMLRVVEPLRSMGAMITGGQDGDRVPLTVTGGSLSGVDHELPMASAQVKSALLFAGMRADGTTTIAEPTPSRDHTERMLRFLGVPIDASNGRLIIKAIDLQTDISIDIPGDLSSAAFLLVTAAIIPGSSVTIEAVGLNPTRSGIIDILRAYGADVFVDGIEEIAGEPRGRVTVRAADRRPVEVAAPLTVAALDELPLVAVLGAFSDGDTVVRDAGELRVKESDRIAAVVGELSALGIQIEATPDGFVVHGRGGTGTAGAHVSAHGDHRIAMALAVAGLAVREGTTRIEGWEVVDVSYPGFERGLDSLVVR